MHILDCVSTKAYYAAALKAGIFLAVKRHRGIIPIDDDIDIFIYEENTSNLLIDAEKERNLMV